MSLNGTQCQDPDCTPHAQNPFRTKISDLCPHRKDRRVTKSEPNHVNISARFTKKTAEAIIKIADQNDTSVAAVVRKLVEKALEAGITI